MTDVIDALRARKDLKPADQAKAIERVEQARKAEGLIAADVVPGFEVYPWSGLARMAHARAAAGRPPSEHDAEAMERFPTP